MNNLFLDQDIIDAKNNNNKIIGKNLQISLPTEFGFCGGVNRALKKMQALLQQPATKEIFLLGEIIHNDSVNNYFIQQNVKIIPRQNWDNIYKICQPNDCIVIPAFGIEKQFDDSLRKFCQQNKIKLIDTTCMFVKRIWNFVEQMAKQNKTIIIHGKPLHPETTSIISRALTNNNCVIIVPNLQSANQLKTNLTKQNITNYPKNLINNPQNINYNNLALTNQTTMLSTETKQIEQILKTNNSKITIAKTICSATQNRQNAAKQICQTNCDLILVIGGYTSSNTTQLYRLAKNYQKTYFINNAKCLTQKTIKHFLPKQQKEITETNWFSANTKQIAILAGASCPPADIGETIRKLKNF